MNIDKPEYSQPISTAIQIALVELLESFGIVPKAVVGHSSGEIAAAYVSSRIRFLNRIANRIKSYQIYDWGSFSAFSVQGRVFPRKAY
jgi:acyl transferase domain-containing protein